jgi:hypothetical protein
MRCRRCVSCHLCFLSSRPKTVHIASDVEFGFGDWDLMGYEGILREVEFGGEMTSSDCVDIRTEVCSGHTSFDVSLEEC